MILADTNIMIDYFHSRESELAGKIDNMPIALCGVVRTEILHGARSEEEIDDYLKAFKTFDKVLTDDYDWEGTGFILQALRAAFEPAEGGAEDREAVCHGKSWLTFLNLTIAILWFILIA